MGAWSAEGETADQQRLSGPKDIIWYAPFISYSSINLFEHTTVELGWIESPSGTYNTRSVRVQRLTGYEPKNNLKSQSGNIASWPEQLHRLARHDYLLYESKWMLVCGGSRRRFDITRSLRLWQITHKQLVTKTPPSRSLRRLPTYFHRIWEPITLP